MLDTNTKHELCCPIKVGELLYGVLNIEESRVRNVFSHGILDGFVAVCEHIGNVIEYARTAKQYIGVQKQVDLLKQRLNLALDVIAELSFIGPSATPIIEKTLRRLFDEIQADALLYYSVSLDANLISFHCRQTYGSLPSPPKQYHQLPMRQGNLLVQAVTDGVGKHGTLANDLDLEHLFQSDLKSDTRSYVLAPMRYSGQCKGLLILVHPKDVDTPDALTEVQKTLQAAGNLLAMLSSIHSA